MRKIFILLIIIVVIVLGITVSLHLTGYLLNDQKIIPPGSELDWKNFEEVYPVEKYEEANNSSKDFPLIVNFTEKIKEIPGIKNINYDIFISNESIESIIESYKNILVEQGYAYQKKYSGMESYESYNIHYYIFIKGFNGIAIYMTTFEEQTWICYSTGSVLQYREIFDYITKNNMS